MTPDVDEMSTELAEYQHEGYWFHITLPQNLEPIRESGIECGHEFTDKQLFDTYYPDREAGPVVQIREDTEDMLENVREDVYPGDTVPGRGNCASVWPDCELAFDMRSAVLGDSHSFGVVVVDPEKLSESRFVLSEYQLVAQVMVNRQMQIAQRDGEGDEAASVSNDDVVEPAVQYWRSATVTNAPMAVTEQSPMFSLPEVLVREGVPAEAIVDVFEHSATEFPDDDSEAPPTV